MWLLSCLTGLCVCLYPQRRDEQVTVVVVLMWSYCVGHFRFSGANCTGVRKLELKEQAYLAKRFKRAMIIYGREVVTDDHLIPMLQLRADVLLNALIQ